MTKINLIKLGLAGVLLVATLCANAVQEVKAQSSVNKVFRRMQSNYKLIKVLKADIRLTNHDAVLGVDDLYEGAVIFVPRSKRNKKFFRVDWVKPFQEYLTVTGHEYVLYRPRLKEAFAGKFEETTVNGPLALLNTNKTQLKAMYSVRYLGSETIEGGVKTEHLEFTPKIFTSYKTAEVWIDGSGMPIRIRVNEQNNDVTTILLSNVKRNLTIPDLLTIKLPANIKTIRQ